MDIRTKRRKVVAIAVCVAIGGGAVGGALAGAKEPASAFGDELAQRLDALPADAAEAIGSGELDVGGEKAFAAGVDAAVDVVLYRSSGNRTCLGVPGTAGGSSVTVHFDGADHAAPIKGNVYLVELPAKYSLHRRSPSRSGRERWAPNLNGGVV